MKKILIGCLLFITACQGATSTPMVVASLTSTALPTLEAATSTPEPTATAFPAPLDFMDEFDIVSPYWEVFQTGGITTPLAAVENGAFRVSINTADTWSIGIHNANTYSNVFVSAQVSANPAGSVGLVCRYDAETGWFEFNLGSDGTYSLLFGKWLDSGIAQYRVISTEAFSKANPAGQENVLGLSCEDNFLRLSVNEIPIINVDVTNYGLTQGYIGITASSFADVPMTGVFEWVKVDSQ